MRIGGSITYDEFMRATTPHLGVRRSRLQLLALGLWLPVWIVWAADPGEHCVVIARTEGKARYRGQKWHLRTIGRWQA